MGHGAPTLRALCDGRFRAAPRQPIGSDSTGIRRRRAGSRWYNAPRPLIPATAGVRMRALYRSRVGLTLLALLTVAGAGVSQPPAAEVTTHMVAMRDGVKLATDVHLPPGGPGTYPVIVARTPYDKGKGGSALAAATTKRGYAFVIQDLRGRFKSEGHHAIIFANDGLGDHQDGRDTLEWIARQPWCDGKIGSWGAS